MHEEDDVCLNSSNIYNRRREKKQAAHIHITGEFTVSIAIQWMGAIAIETAERADESGSEENNFHCATFVFLRSFHFFRSILVCDIFTNTQFSIIIDAAVFNSFTLSVAVHETI